MKTIKNLLSIFVLITSLAFVSCENEPIDQSLLNNNSGNGSSSGGGSNTGGGGSTATTLITKAIFTYPSAPTEIMNYVYNGNKILEVNYGGTNEKTVYEYTGNLITKDFEYTGSTVDEMAEYTYDSSNRMINVKNYSYSGGTPTLNSEYFYTYNTNDTVTVIKKENSIVVSNGIIYFNGNQPFKYVETIVATGNVITLECEYDSNKNNALNNILGYNAYILNSPESGFEGIGKNLIKISENGTSIDQFNYNYNSNNYPINGTTTFYGQTANLEIFYN